MHELSIAYSIVESAEEAARNAGVKKVRAVNLRLGKLSGVVKDALLFSFDIAAQETLLEGATLNIEELNVIAHCPTCNENVELPSVQIFRCPVCNTPTPTLIQGKELELTSLEIDDANEQEVTNATASHS